MKNGGSSQSKYSDAKRWKPRRAGAGCSAQPASRARTPSGTRDSRVGSMPSTRLSRVAASAGVSASQPRPPASRSS